MMHTVSRENYNLLGLRNASALYIILDIMSIVGSSFQ